MLVPVKIRRAGVLLAGISLLFAFWSVRIGYQMWQTPPPFLLEQADSMLLFQFSVISAVCITFVVGVYLARNIYRWSMATPDDAVSAGDT